MSSSSFKCKRCGEELYLNNAVLSDSGKRIPLERIFEQPYDCPNSEYGSSSSSYSKIIRCNKCTNQITFSESVLSKSGKMISLNTTTYKPHRCSLEFVIKCRGCDRNITFRDDRLSQSGKKIPLNALTYEPHQCIKKAVFGV